MYIYIYSNTQLLALLAQVAVVLLVAAVELDHLRVLAGGVILILLLIILIRRRRRIIAVVVIIIITKII